MQVLRGSKARDIQPWMTERRLPGYVFSGGAGASPGGGGPSLYGSGAARSEAYWKGLHGLLVGRGLIELKSLQGRGGGSYTVSAPTPAGAELLHARGAWAGCAPARPLSQRARASSDDGGEAQAAGPRLRLRLPAALLQEDAAAQAAAAAERARQQARADARAAADGAAAERERLVEALRAERKRVADGLGQAPETLVNDVTLRNLSQLLPRSLDEAALVSGMGREALRLYGGALTAAIASFCDASVHLKHARSEWVVRGGSGGGGGGGSRPGSAVGGGGAVGAAGGDAAAAAAGLPEPAAAADPALLRRLEEIGALREPKGAALEALQRWRAGEGIEAIAENRAKPIQPASVVGYLAEGVAYEYPAGAKRLLVDAGLWGPRGGSRALWRSRAALLDALEGRGVRGNVRAVKEAAGDDATYGDVKAAAAALALGMLPDALASAATASPALAAARAGAGGATAAAAAGGSQQLEGGAQDGAQEAPPPPPLPPHLACALQPPSAQALAVHRRWLEGLPLAEAGDLGDGVVLGVSTLLRGDGHCGLSEPLCCRPTKPT